MNTFKFSIAVLILSFALSARAEDCDWQAEAYNQTKKLNCDIREIAKAIREGGAVVPKVIYHFGKREYLEQDIKQGNVPKEAWDKFIMGSNTRYHLEENRRGLYGTGGIDLNSFGGEEYNWLMEIHIKDSCRQPANVVAMHGMAKTDRFKKWFEGLPEEKRTFASPQAYDSECFDPYMENPKSMYTGDFHGNDKCAKFTNFYLADSGAKIVQDFVIQKAFYIRDRDCVETIKGTPKELIDMASRNDLLWISPCGMNSGARAFIGMVQKALAEAKPAYPPEVTDKLIQNAKLAQVPTDTLEAYKRCTSKGEMEKFSEALGDRYKTSWQSVCN